MGPKNKHKRGGGREGEGVGREGWRREGGRVGGCLFCVQKFFLLVSMYCLCWLFGWFCCEQIHNIVLGHVGLSVYSFSMGAVLRLNGSD